MNIYPLAIYTANHGLSWNYPKDEIPFQEIDACRKAFGALPDFDAGAKGFSGILAKGDRVFVMRCQSVLAWDFRGRNATYLAVTWLPRDEAGTTDFDRLLDSEAMSEPSKTPPLFFKAEVTSPRRTTDVSPTPYLVDGFARAGAIIAGMDGKPTIAIKRIAGSRQASLTVSNVAEHNVAFFKSKRQDTSQGRKNDDAQPDVQVALMVLLVIWFITVSITIIIWLKWQGAMDVNKNLVAQQKVMKENLEELKRDNKEFLAQVGTVWCNIVDLNLFKNELLIRDPVSPYPQSKIYRWINRNCICPSEN